MYFDSAFLHLQINGDHLVGLSLTQEIDDRQLRGVRSIPGIGSWCSPLDPLREFPVAAEKPCAGMKVPPASTSLSAAKATSASIDVVT
jgi:hypothetical protein